MKKILSLMIIFLALGGLFAQVSVDPTDVFYKEAQSWELKGYIDPLPLIRPYPNYLIKSILEKVIDCGNKTDGEIALYEYERIFGKKLNKYITGAGQYKSSQRQKDDNHEKETTGTKNIKGEGGIAGEVSFHPMVSLGYDLAIYAETADFDDISPYYTNKPEDSVFDPVTIGPIEEYLDWNMNIAAGTDSTYMICGINKTGYGPFLCDGLALNDSAYHSANITFSVTRPKFSYASTFQMIGAKTNNPDEYSNLGNGKYLAFHAIKYRFNQYVDFTYYENILFGPRTNLAYLFPVPYMPVQNIGGASDNLQMGIMLEVKPAKGLVWATDIFVDDLDVNNVVKLNFDSKNRCAGQTGLIYTPENNTCKYLALNYTLIIPYVYTHWEYDEGSNSKISGDALNYQNYTNSGVNIGSSLDPNSDKVSFIANFQPKPFIKLNFTTNFIRHANSAEAFGKSDAAEYVLANKGQYSTDGSATMHQMFDNEGGARGTHVEQAWESLGFMTSDHKMGILQTGLSAQFDFPNTKHGQFSLLAGYTFEYVHNNGVRRHIYEGGNLSWTTDTATATDSTGKEYTYTIYKLNGTTYDDGSSTKGSWKKLKNSSDVQTEVANQKEAWVNALTDKINHYITLGFKYTF